VPLRSVIAILGLLWLSAGRLSAAAVFADPIPPAPLEQTMLADASGRQFHQFSLIEAALIASGVRDSGELADYANRYTAWLNAIRPTLDRETDDQRRTELLFDFMHRRILSGVYNARATELMHPFDDGSYNCVSATVLFAALALDCGLNVHAIERPRHAMCVLHSGGTRLNIETTCPNWFQIASAEREQAEAAAIARAAGDAPVANRREVSPAQLVAVIYYNRGVDLLRDGRPDQAVSVNLRAIELDPQNETARGNLLASVNNWALARSATGDFRGAADLLAAGRRLAPEHEPFQVNQRHVYRLWIQSLADANQKQAARDVLAEARQADPESPLWNLWSVRLR
jgi:tetratricopeptide (TPR) repeat protein